MNDWLKIINGFNRAGLSPAIILVAMVLIWNGRMMETYTTGMMSQVKQIHAAQVDGLKASKEYQKKTDKLLANVSNRLVMLEAREELLGMPLYQEDNKLYLKME